MYVVNGYEIAKVECSTQWGCIKLGQYKGLMFKTKKAAVAYALDH
jgi:hypothetical protein